MNKLPTYTEQFNKITEAYIKGEIKPMDARFCFCGTLDREWDGSHPEVYRKKEYAKMECALFSTFPECKVTGISSVSTPGGYFIDDDYKPYNIELTDGYEDKLFNGMVAALEVLKQIHIEHGEVIAEEPVFTKRILQTVNP